jgi:hypothetical protein
LDTLQFRGLGIVATVAVMGCAGALPVRAQQDVPPVVIDHAEPGVAVPNSTPNKTSLLDTVTEAIERRHLIELFTNENGLFPRVGTIGGGGIAFGVGFVRPIGRAALFSTSADWSSSGYRRVQARVALPHFRSDRVELEAGGSYHYSPREEFYGLGPNSTDAERSSFLSAGADFHGTATIRPSRWLTTGARLGHLASSIRGGKDGSLPSIEQRFSSGTAPGIDRQQGFVYQSFFIDADSRDDPEDATQGGQFRADWTRYAGRESSRTNFSQLRLGGARFFAISDTRIVSFGGEAVVSQVANGHEVPFYLQPTLTSFGPLRGFGLYRFRDRDVVLVNLEYRWKAFRNLQMSAFADAGTVGPRVSALGLSSWKDGYGLGLRFSPYKDLLCHVDVRASSEGVRYFLDFKVRSTSKP